MSSLGIRKEQVEFLLDVVKLITFVHESGLEVTGGELHRTQEQQEIYFKTGRSKTMNSNHLKRLAIDLFIFRKGELILSKPKLQFIGDFWEKLNQKNRWGGNYKTFQDTPHFERNT
jgi:peptidoglycan L-alanyl-D-glutamate endopeptidase CwlK